MTEPQNAFHKFEQQGWNNANLAAVYHDQIAPVTKQAVPALLDAAAVGSGTRVLDVATGAGYAAAAARDRGAEVVGIDFSLAQIELARQTYPGIEFREGDALHLPSPDGRFDAVISNFGVPHFPDPDAFFREAFRVLRSGGRLAFATWASAQEVVGFGAIYEAVQKHGRMDVGLPTGPNFFLFANPDESHRCLSAAGFRTPELTKVPQEWELPSADALFEAVLRGSVRAAALLRGQTAEAAQAIRAAVREIASGFDKKGGSPSLCPP